MEVAYSTRNEFRDWNAANFEMLAMKRAGVKGLNRRIAARMYIDSPHQGMNDRAEKSVPHGVEHDSTDGPR